MQKDFDTAETVENFGVDSKELLLDNYYSLMLHYSRIDQLGEAIIYGELALDLQKLLSTNPDDEKVADRSFDLADLYQHQGRVNESIKMYRQALIIRKRIEGDKGSQQLVKILEKLAIIYVVQKDSSEAQKLLDESQGYRQKLGLVSDSEFEKLKLAIDNTKNCHQNEHSKGSDRWQNLIAEASKLYDKSGIAAVIPIAEKAFELTGEIFFSPNNNQVNFFNFIDEASRLYNKSGIAAVTPITEKALELAEEIFVNPNNDRTIRLNSFINEASKLYKKSGIAAVITITEKALELTKEMFFSPNNDIVVSMNNLAKFYESQKSWKDAETLYKRALEMREKLYPDSAKPNNDLATSLNNLATFYRQHRRLGEAKPLYVRALEIREKLYSDSIKPNNDLATSLDNLAELYDPYNRMEEAKAERMYLRALEIREKLYSDPTKPNHDLANSLFNLAKLYESQCRLKEAESLYLRALEIREKLYFDSKKKNISLTTSIFKLAKLYESQLRFKETETLFNRALKMYFDDLEMWNFDNFDLPNNLFHYVDLANSISHLAELYESQSRFEDAEILIVIALGILEKLEEWDDNYREKILCNPVNPYNLFELAKSYEYQRRWDKAEQTYLKALEIIVKLYPDPAKPHNDMAVGLTNLATLYESRGLCNNAEPLYVEALWIVEQLYPDPKNPHHNLATSLNNLAKFYESKGSWNSAEQLYVKTLKIREKLYPDSTNPHNDLAISLNNLARLYKFQGKWRNAEPLYLRVLEIREQMFSKTGQLSLELISSVTNLGLARAQHQQEVSLSLFQRAIELENQWLNNIIFVWDSQSRIKDLEKRQYQLSYLLALTQQHFPNNTLAVTSAFNATLSRKGQATSAEINISQAIRNQPQLASELEQLRGCRQEIATFSYATGDRSGHQDRFNILLEQCSNLETQLAISIPAINLAQQIIDRKELTRLLPEDTFLVEFVRYDDYDFIKHKWQAARYLAFIVRLDVEGVTAIDCGLAEPLEEEIEKFRHAYTKIDFSGQNSGVGDLFQKPEHDAESASQCPQPDLIDRLLPHLPATGTCYIAPDSYLHILPFHLLKTPDGKYLGDLYRIHYLTTARDIYRRKTPTSSNPPMIIANPDYNGGSNPTSFVNPKTGLQFSHDIDGQAFDPLYINQILGDSIAKRYQVPCYSDVEATVDQLEKLKAPHLLVIATHGFSLPTQQDFIAAISRCRWEQEEKILLDHRSEITQTFRDYWQKKADEGNEWSKQLLLKIDNIGIHKSTDLLATPISDPMLRSGIALAGANIWRFQGTPSPKFGKGVALAQDIAQLDLWGTELTIFVTCVGALGEVKNSGGVFGLRRALSIAGAKYVITSLWNIPTKPSVLLMDKFFDLYQSEAHPTPPEALAAAQFYVRNISLGELKQSEVGREIIAELQSDRVRGLRSDATDDVKPLADPHFWGAWICQG
jgi:tetratricopeptide (TPR) repeat protein